MKTLNVTIHLPNSRDKLPMLQLNEDISVGGYEAFKGFISDGASIPWVFRRWFPALAAYTPAAIIHDLHCDIANVEKSYGSRRVGDAVFYKNCVVHLGRPKYEALFLYAGVSVGSFIAYFRYKL